MPQHLIYIPGTNEPMPPGGGRPLGMLGVVADQIDRIAPDLFTHHTVKYPAEYGNPASYGDSRTIGERRTHQLVRDVGGARLIGYSQGAVIAGNVSAARPDVPCGYLLADALRPRGANSTGMLGQPGHIEQEDFHGWGVAGQRPVEVARWYSIVGDVIADAWPDSLARDVADLSEFMGFTGLDDMQQWGTDLITKIKASAWQNLPLWRRLLARPGSFLALGDVGLRSIREGLDFPRIHTSYGTTEFLNHRRTYLQEMARDIVDDSTRSEEAA